MIKRAINDRLAVLKDFGSLVRLLPQKPRRLIVDLGNRCNYMCRHCSQKAGPEEPFISGDSCINLPNLKTLHDHGILHMTYSGGEPTMHPEILHMTRMAKEAGFSVCIVSNGSNFDPSFCKELANAGCDEVALSLYSHIPESHDWVTRVPGSLAKLVDAAENLRIVGMGIRINFVVMAHNARDLVDENFWIFLNGLQPNRCRIIHVSPQGRAATEYGQLCPNPVEYVSVRNHLLHRHFPFRVTMQKYYWPKNEQDMREMHCRNRLGHALALMANGVILPCCYLSGSNDSDSSEETASKMLSAPQCVILKPIVHDELKLGCPMIDVEVSSNSRI